MEKRNINVWGIQVSRKAVMVAVFVLLGLFVLSFISNMVNSRKVKDLRSNIRTIENENKRLRKQMDSLNRQYSFDSIALQVSIQEAENLRLDREQLLQEIREITNNLYKFKNQYAKVSDYKNVPADSLVRLFNRRFDY
jgi:uncharacterized membrane protein YhiD involved in acid resistance